MASRARASTRGFALIPIVLSAKFTGNLGVTQDRFALIPIVLSAK